MNTKMIENAKEVRDLVFLTLQEHNDWVTSSAIANELGLGREQVKTALTKLKSQHPEIISDRSFGYKITAAKKNSEGYSDLTASTAIDAVCDSQSGDKDREYNTSYYGACYDNILPGTLWETASSKGDPEDPRPWIWFWEWLENLGIDERCSGEGFDVRYIDQQIDRWLSGKGTRRGRGTPFPLRHFAGDQRVKDIWQQCMAYINEREAYF